MLKKFIVVIVIFGLVVVGLQLFGGRDFGQVPTAWEKYRHGGDLVSLGNDIGIIFAGDKISVGGLATAKLAERLIYRWTDEQGVVHNSERMPNVENYEVIRMGDIKIETQKALDKEEIKKALKN